MKNIHFIINPIAGAAKFDISSEIINTYFEPNQYQVTLKYSLYKKHATALTLSSIHENAHIIVACGGDGTINEVASCIVSTDIVLGIIATGSGNGLAHNLNIPHDTFKALELIKSESIKQIDFGSFNNHFFFSNAGLGFDAKVVKSYEDSGIRKLASYLRASLKTLRDLNYENQVQIEINNETVITNHFMIFISNSNELGYKVSLTPKASLQDGLFDVLIISKLSKLKVLLFGILMLFKKHHLLKEVHALQTKNIKLTRLKGATFNVQIDGEFHALSSEDISISINEKALKVIA